MQTTTHRHPAIPLLTRQVNAFRLRQRFDGSIENPVAQDRIALQDIQRTATALYQDCGQHGMVEPWTQDVGEWIAQGLDSSPCFDRVRDAYTPPPDGSENLFIGPVITANGPAPRGYHLECFIARREDPAEVGALERTHPHPKNKCESTRLLAASTGFMEGNCIVFFPENIRTRSKVSSQQYALFFFNKFKKIYDEITVRNTAAILGPELAAQWLQSSHALPPQDCYRARCVWGYLHDYYHHCGPLPLDGHLQLKLNWHAGLLEEIKVDSQVILECLSPDVPYGPSVVEFVLLERLFRYPVQADVRSNFDSGTGVFLFEWLAEHGAIAMQGDRITAIRREAVYEALRHLVVEIEAFERTTLSDEYREKARQLVHRYLNPPSQPGDRFEMPPRLQALLAAAGPSHELHFADLAY